MDDNVWKLLALFGGLGGSALTFVLGRWTVERTRPRLGVRRHIAHFSAPLPYEQLQVSYKGKVYKALAYCELMIRNTGTVMVPPGLIHGVLGDGGSLVDLHSASQPENIGREIVSDPRLPANKIVLKFDALAPGDFIRYGLLVSDTREFSHEFRGDPNVRIVDLALVSHSKKRLLEMRKTLLAVIFFTVAIAVLGLLDYLKSGALNRDGAFVVVVLVVAIALLRRQSREAWRRHQEAQEFVPVLGESTGKRFRKEALPLITSPPAPKDQPADTGGP